MADEPLVADLHSHTTNSDGEMALADVPVAAKAANLDAVAITDHDRLHPGLDTPWEYRDGVRLIHGIELRVEADGQRVDLLGYGVEPTMDLERETERLQTDRVQRGRQIIENLEAELGVELDIEAHPGLGRPNIARAVTEVTDLSVNDVFDRYIGDDGPCFVARDVPDFETGRELLEDACALVGLAHPFRYDDPHAALELCEHLDAVERWYPYADDIDPEPDLLAEAIGTFDLLSTGGSDAHDHTLGVSGMTPTAYDRFLAATELPHP